MFVRLLFLLLIALNVGVGAWLVFGHAPTPPMPPATDPGVPELKLVSEQPLPAAKLAASRSRTEAGRGSGHCLSIGPFDTRSGTSAALDALTPHVADIQYRQDQVTSSTGWWVYLPPLPTREQALDMARQLSAKGVNDYYVITAGDRQNTISLGLFHDPDNAMRLQKKLQGLGFHPQVKQRTETLPQYWVDIALPDKPGFDWHAYIQRTDVKAKPVACF